VTRTTLRRHPGFQPIHRVGLQCVLLAAWTVGAIAVRPSVADEPVRVRGVVRFDGVVPKAKTADEAGQRHDLFDVHPKTCGLRDAVVYWIDAPAEPLPSDAGELPVVVVDQKDFTFLPHVVSVRSGQPVKFTNSDSANHNVRTSAFELMNQFNVFTGAGHEYVHRFVADKKQRPTRLGCDIHAWMGGWIYTFDHAHHAVTDAEGRFELPELPAGPQRLAIRQPDGNLRRDVKVEVIAGKTTTLEVGFRDTDLVR
jgi:plastocyanin